VAFALYAFAALVSVAAQRTPGRQVSGIFDLAYAPSVVFVCEPGGGSMMTKWDPVRNELARAVAALRPGQRFGLIFTAPDGCFPVARELLPPTGENLAKARRLLDRGGHGLGGTNDPLPALRLALGLKPAVLFLMTDGDYSNDDEVLTLIRKLNADKKTRIHTIALIDHDETYEKFLRQVAAENGGSFKFVADRDLGAE
jgi:hypothetical protein